MHMQSMHMQGEARLARTLALGLDKSTYMHSTCNMHPHPHLRMIHMHMLASRECLRLSSTVTSSIVCGGATSGISRETSISMGMLLRVTVHAHARDCACAYVHISTSAYVCICACAYVDEQTHVYAHMYVHIHVPRYICMNNAHTVGAIGHHHELGARRLVGVVQNDHLIRCKLICILG